MDFSQPGKLCLYCRPPNNQRLIKATSVEYLCCAGNWLLDYISRLYFETYVSYLSLLADPREALKNEVRHHILFLENPSQVRLKKIPCSSQSGPRDPQLTKLTS